MTLVAFEGIAIATVMPVVGRELDGLAIYAWSFGAYVAASLLGMVTAGSWCDSRGPRRPLLVGSWVFGVGAALAGFAPTMEVLIGARFIQGLGGGALIVALYVLIARAYDENLRPRAFSVLSAAWVLPSLIGPLIAGWLAEYASWRWAFWLVPVVMVIPLLTLRGVLRAHEGDQGVSPRPGRVWAAVGGASGLLLLQVALIRPGGLSLPMALIAAAFGVALLIPSAWRLLPPGALVLRRGLASTVLMRGILAGCFFSAEAFLPLALVSERGVSVTWAGMILAVASAGWLLGSFWQSRLPGGQDRSPAVVTGTVLVVLGLATAPLCLVPSFPVWICVFSWLIGALGMGLSFPSINVQAMRLSPVAEQGVNSSALQISDAMFSALALAIAGAIHAAAVASGGAQPSTYTLMWLLAAAGALAATVVARRMTPAR
jgi:MFS family permease